jgi:hypothetical protein
MRRAAIEREVGRRATVQALADARALSQALEDGRIPSGLYRGRRVEILAVQDHPAAGARVWIKDGGTCWVPAAEVMDIRGEPRRSVVPPGLF